MLLASISILLMFIVRFVLAAQPFKLPFLKAYGKAEAWIQPIREVAKGHPVVFFRSYQSASKYWFYSCDTAYSYNTARYRENQYDIWSIEEQLQGQTVLAMDPLDHKNNIMVKVGEEMKAVTLLDNFTSYGKINIKRDEKPLVISAGKRASVDLIIENPYNYPVKFDTPGFEGKLGYYLYEGGKVVDEKIVMSLASYSIDAGSNIPLKVEVNYKEPGDFQILFFIKPGKLPPSFNGRYEKIRFN